jgi:hypothetical protein
MILNSAQPINSRRSTLESIMNSTQSSPQVAKHLIYSEPESNKNGNNNSESDSLLNGNKNNKKDTYIAKNDDNSEDKNLIEK